MSEIETEVASYFDSDYYQSGYKKGTRYADYLENALDSSIYRGMAKAIMEVYKPGRVLEIGCAAGPIVKHLNDMGSDAHGIDVSEWAVENRFHPNVLLASADDLPYDSQSFDLVFSCHALEHLPDAIADRAFAEMGRVAARHQFHMMPIIGIPPYHGPLEPTIANLKSDPTHNLLYDRAWWYGKLARHGWHPVPANILMDADNTFFEFSTCQVLLSRSVHDAGLLRSVQDFNQSFFNRVSLWELHRMANANRQAPTAVNLGTMLRVHSLSLRDGVWGDLSHSFPDPANLRDGTLYLFCRVSATAGVNLRVAALSFKEGFNSGAYDPDGIAGVAQRAIELGPGYSAVELRLNEFVLSYGAPRVEGVDMVMLGGESKIPADVECVCVVKTPRGVSQLFGPSMTLFETPTGTLSGPAAKAG
jgi:SAM-dependent methyltransferase